MKFDPKAALEHCETLMLDMDGTVLDLAYDNYMWMTHVPGHYAAKHGMSLSAARRHLFSKFGAVQGDLTWYCLDHWSERLGLDVIKLHRDEHHRIDYLPGAREFLEVVKERHIRVLLVTNSHPDTLQLKDEVTGLTAYFDGIYSSHSFGFAKERQEFWLALQEEVGFEIESTMFVDDSQPVLKSACVYGVSKLVSITRPDTSEALREDTEFAAVEGVLDLL
jgi:HAD superfamily hydrolase (TIGR01509 family)